MFFTFVLAYVVLAVATTKASESWRTKHRFHLGLSIASCMTAGGFAIGGISGGVLNPAIALGIATESFHWGSLLTYILWQASGALLAGVCFRITHPEEFNGPNQDESKVETTTF